MTPILAAILPTLAIAYQRLVKVFGPLLSIRGSAGRDSRE